VLTSVLRNATELVSELEFVWSQIKDNSPSASEVSGRVGTGASTEGAGRQVLEPVNGTEGPMRILSPMSEEDEAEQDYQRRIGVGDDEGDDGEYVRKGGRWPKKMERAIVRLSAEVAALREQITTGREWRSRRERSIGVWTGWFLWTVLKHLTVDAIVLGIVLLWMRRRKDRRLEDHVRAALRVVREYVGRVLPSR